MSSSNMLTNLGRRIRGDSQSASRIYAALLALVAAGGLVACGFHLRGEYNVPFASVYLSAPGTSQVAVKLRRELANSPTKLMPTAAESEAQLNISEERRERTILSLSGAGRVREYQLKLRVQYQLVDNKGNVPIPSSEIQLHRIMTYDDSQVIAKLQEETLLYKDMELDAANQILRRMTAIKR